MILRFVFAIAGVFGSLAPALADTGAATAEPERPIPIRIGWQIPAATQAQIVQVLKRTNVLEIHGLEPRLVPFSYGTPQVEAALQGNLDAVFLGDQPALDIVSRGHWKIVARLYYDRVAIMVPPDSPVRRIGDLAGKEVASPFGSTAHREVTLRQTSAGLDPETDVNNRDFDILEIRRRVLSATTANWGELDAVAAWEPTASQFELEQRARTLEDSVTLGVIALSRNFIESHPEAAQQFLVAVRQAWRYFARHPREVIQWYIDDSNLGYAPEALLSAARLDPNFQAKSLTDVDLSLTDEDLAKLRRAAQWGRQQGYVSGDFRLSRAVDQSLLAGPGPPEHAVGEIRVILPTARESPMAAAADIYFIDRFPLWFMFGFMVVCSFTAIEVGQWLGRQRRKRRKREPEGAIGTAVGAVLALLAFVIALTFSAAGNRFDERKQALLDEVNAIGTAYLRAGLLPEPQRTTTRLLLHDYVEIRLGMYRVFGDPEKLRAVEGRTSALQESIWSRAAELAQSDPRSQVYALFTDSVNDVFDLHTTRVVLGAEYRIPQFVWYALGVVSVMAMAAVGFQFGITGRRSLMASLTLSITFALVILLILDLDRPGAGLIDVNQQPMLELYQGLGRQE